MAVILRYFSELGVLRKSSRSLSHLLMSSCFRLTGTVRREIGSSVALFFLVLRPVRITATEPSWIDLNVTGSWQFGTRSELCRSISVLSLAAMWTVVERCCVGAGLTTAMNSDVVELRSWRPRSANTQPRSTATWGPRRHGLSWPPSLHYSRRLFSDLHSMSLVVCVLQAVRQFCGKMIYSGHVVAVNRLRGSWWRNNSCMLQLSLTRIQVGWTGR